MKLQENGLSCETIQMSLYFNLIMGIKIAKNMWRATLYNSNVLLIPNYYVYRQRTTQFVGAAGWFKETATASISAVANATHNQQTIL